MKATKKKASRGRRRPITAEDLLCLVGVGDARMSPDGRSVAVVRKVVGAKNAYETSVWIADADARRAPRVTAARRRCRRGSSARRRCADGLATSRTWEADAAAGHWSNCLTAA